MHLPKKFHLIGSIFIMVSLIVSLFVRIRYGISIPTDTTRIILAIILVVFFFSAIYVSKRCSPTEKMVYYTWLMGLLFIEVTNIFSYWISLAGHVVSMIIIIFSIYYSVKVLK